MMFTLEESIRLIGVGQLGVLCASALVPIRLEWKCRLVELPLLMRQLYWIYGGYTVMSIVALGLVCLTCSKELATGGLLATAVSGYGATFWSVRLALQAILAARPFLTRWWLTAGYHLLTCLFVTFAGVYLVSAMNAWRSSVP